MRQQLVVGELVIPKGGQESTGLDLHANAVILTVYAPAFEGFEAIVEVSSDKEHYLPYYHKGVPVMLFQGTAIDVPIPACKSLRVRSLAEQDQEQTFHVLELLEI